MPVTTLAAPPGHASAPEIIPNDQKLKELILYVAEKSAADPLFGAVKLNKILFFADFWAYGELGYPITGVEYQRLQNGPAPRHLVPLRKQLEEERALAIQPAPSPGGYVRQRPVNLRRANLAMFTAQEISIVDDVIRALRRANAKTCSLISHDWLGWQLSEDGETIPYSAAFLSHEPPTPFEIDRGKELSKKWERRQ